MGGASGVKYMATLKIKRAVKEIGVNGGNISKAMRTVGYAPSTAARTDKLTRRKGFKELLEKELPDGALLKVHKEGLRADKKVFKNNNESGEIELVSEEPDYAVRHKYLETGYKVKGKLSDPEGGNKTLIVVISGESAKRYGGDTTPSTV